MKRNTMKWRIIKYNIIVILGFILLSTAVFNIAIRFYMERDISRQLSNIANRAEETALRQGPGFLKPSGAAEPAVPPAADKMTPAASSDNIYEFYFMLDRSLRDTLSVLNADYILFNTEKEVINANESGYFDVPANVLAKINAEFSSGKDINSETYLNFSSAGTNYIAIIKPVSQKNSFGLGWIVIYSSLEKINQLQLGVNAILFIILILSSLVVVSLSSLAAKKISAPFASLSKHMSEIAQRNFCTKLDMPADEELQEVVKNINVMTEKLESYDKAQQTFLQNASHEFRTPLMAIQSYAEGIKYEVVDTETAVNVIIEETKRMTNLVGDLLYLSRLDTIEENYRFQTCNMSTLIADCISRLSAMALQNDINISFQDSSGGPNILADAEKMSRAITNIIANDIRYAASTVYIDLKLSAPGSNLLVLSILDDGPGFDEKELPNIFSRFYKGKKGNFGLGLAIARNVIEKHNGKIWARNTDIGALFTIELPIRN